MKVAIYRGGTVPISIEEVEEPRPAPDEVLLKVGFCGICGSDVSMTAGKGWDYEPGSHLGHEYCGEVIERGSQVHDLRVGDLVACVPNGFCGSCRACSEGRLLSCRNGKAQMGGMGEYVAVTARSAVRLPNSVGLEAAALVEPVACARRALNEGGVRAGDHLLVIGAGPLALAVIHNAVLKGATRIGVLARSSRGREMAMRFGASYYLSGDGDDDDGHAARLQSDPPDIVVECAGAPGLMAQAIDIVRPAGTIIGMGMCHSPEPLLPVVCTFKELKMIFPLGYSIEDFEATIRDFHAAATDPTSMVSSVIPLPGVPGYIEAMRRGERHGKGLVRLSG